MEGGQGGLVYSCDTHADPAMGPPRSSASAASWNQAPPGRFFLPG